MAEGLREPPGGAGRRRRRTGASSGASQAAVGACRRARGRAGSGSFGARSWAWPAVAIGVPPRRINEIVHGKRGITADTAVRLAKYFGNSAEFWMNLQSHYELRIERRALRAQVDAIQPIEHAS